MAKEVNPSMGRVQVSVRIAAALAFTSRRSFICKSYILYFIFYIFIWNCLVESNIFFIFASEKKYPQF